MMSQFRSVKTKTSTTKRSPLAFLALASLMSSTILPFTQSSSFAQPSAPAPQEASPASAYGSDYILGAGDQVQINMFGQEELFATPYRVLIDGTISLPFIGRVRVGGSTINAAQVDIAQRYTQFFKRPYVTVVLVEPRDIKVTIAGEVQRPGPYPLAPEEENPTVSSLVLLAGGHTQSADLQRVYISRPQQGGAPRIIQADMLRLIRNGDGSQNYFLRDGDTVIIPTATSPELAASNLLIDNSLNPEQFEPLNIAVVGEVFRPGPYVISPADSVVQEAGDVGTQVGGNNRSGLPTVSQAIQRAGGIKPEADVRQIQVRRQNHSGEEQILEVDLWKLLQEGDLKQDIALQTRDTIIIPTAPIQDQSERIQLTQSTLSPETISVNVVGEVRSPGLVQISPNTPLTQAVLSAGGFDSRRAKKSSVDLIRMSPDGTVSRRRIALDYNGKIDEETNPVLKDNDVVVVRRKGITTFGDTVSNALAPFNALNVLRIFPGL